MASDRLSMRLPEPLRSYLEKLVETTRRRNEAKSKSWLGE